MRRHRQVLLLLVPEQALVREQVARVGLQVPARELRTGPDQVQVKVPVWEQCQEQGQAQAWGPSPSQESALALA